ncbi:MAG TPA: hypothetical protein VII96_13330 [Acidimicrobiales bacterium]
MASGTESLGTIGAGSVACADRQDPFRVWRELQEPPAPAGAGLVDARVAPVGPGPAPTASDLRALADLDDPRLVLSEAYVGLDRRRTGTSRALSRITYVPRRSLLRLDVLIVLAVVSVVLGAALVMSTRPHPAPRSGITMAAVPTGPFAALPQTDPAVSTVPTTVPPPAPPAPAAPAAAPAAAPVVDPSSPESMGAAALALVRYPWQQLVGYTIKFLPIADAPSPGFYGNSDFTWGKSGGVSTMYVYPGETVDQLAGITAFEIGHEVDAAYVEPQDGHDQIAGILGVHPASWAPECDCAEQGYLSGWYAAAFSDYWSPGVGAWSSFAPPPTGATLTALQPWLDPRVP